MLVIGFLHATSFPASFRVFLHVVHRGIRDDASRSHRMTHMLAESDFTAPHFPCASVIPSELGGDFHHAQGGEAVAHLDSPLSSTLALFLIP
jgi:hypothetical protein